MSLYQKYVFRLILILVVILSMWFVAAVLAPTAVHFEQNVTPIYDEGNFSINWTDSGTDAINFSIYISIDGGTNFYIKESNHSITGYSFSNTTDANYTFIIEAANSTPSYANSTMYNMSVDTTAPTISLPVYTNATIKKNTEQLTLNISASDAKSGLTGSHCLIDVNGTNQTVTINSGWCNSTVINLTGANDGNQTLNVYVNDTVNNFGLNNSFVVLVDTTAPTISLSESSSTRTTIIVSFSCNDAISGISSCSLSSSSGTVSSSTISSLSCGTGYTVTVTAEDNAGNIASSSQSMFTSNCRGGGLPIFQPPKKIHSWTLITPGVAAIMKDFDSEIGIRQIQIDVNNPAQNVKITVTKHDGKPAEVTVEKSGKVYQYLQIGAENLENTLDKARVEFRIEISWAAGVGIGKNDIAVFRYNEAVSRWDELTTTSTGEDTTYYYYEVELDEFSYFAISEKAVVSEEPVLGVEESKTWLWILVAVAIIAIIIWRMKIKKK